MIAAAAMVYQPPVKYPRWFSTLDRGRIDDALATYDAPIADSVSRDVMIIRREYASRAAAEQAVRAVFQVIVQVLDSHLEYRPVQRLRAEAHRMLGDVIAWAEPSLPSTGDVRSTLDDATTMMRAARETGPSWLTLMTTVPPATGHPPVVAPMKAHPPSLPSPASAQASTPRRNGPFTRQAAWLAQQLLLAGNLTPNRLKDLGGPDGKTTTRLLQGHGSRDDVLHKVVQGLNEANQRAQRKVVITIHDIPRD